MKIIMMHDVPHLGEEGDIREVTNGYARNYLFPKKYAVPYNDHYLHILEQRSKTIEKRKQEKRLEASGVKEKLEQEQLEFIYAAGENGKLFGSITNGHIAEELEKRGYQIEKKRIFVPDHTIKQIGDYKIKIKLYENEEAEIKLSVKAQENTQEKTKGKVKEKAGKKVKEKAEVKAEEKVKEKAEVKAEEKVKEKAEVKSKEKADEKTQEKANE
ncbi:MAG: 50S ribosomal protein L9 [Spirochaetales bacterium]|nr:50S ribosomal protein L9 [Spirochaetales bacterium]